MIHEDRLVAIFVVHACYILYVNSTGSYKPAREDAFTLSVCRIIESCSHSVRLNITDLRMRFTAVIVASAIATVTGHSWADIVGGGSYRGAQAGGDLGEQRYFCPLATLAQCQPPAKNNVVLPPDAMRPCRTDFPTPKWGSGTAGQPMYVHWAGNGHTGADQSGGTCVRIAIAPYALDPDMSTFRDLATCLPFAHDGGITDASVVLPADLKSGQYTVFWEWDFAPFWFSSCSDINVVGAGGATIPPPVTTGPTATIARPASTAAPITTKATTKAPVTIAPATPAPSGPVSSVDCKTYSMPNAQCAALYGPASHCESWVADKCGRSHCTGTTFDDSHC